MKKLSKEELKKVVLKSEEFFANAEPSTLLEDAYKARLKKREKAGIICGCMDPVWQKRNRDWNKLANKVVGCE